MLEKTWKPSDDGLVAEVGLGETEEQVALQVAEVGLHAQRFAQTEEVVGLIVEAEEGAGEAADAAIQADGVLALLVHAQQQGDGVVRRVLRRGGVLVDLERVEVLELVEAEQALLPKIAVVDLAFFEQQLAADDGIAGDGVAGELDPRDVVRLAFIDVDVEVTASSWLRRSAASGLPTKLI